MNQLETTYATIELGNAANDESCAVLAYYFDGQPNIYHISEEQYRSARSVCNLAEGDVLYRYGVKSDTRTMVVLKEEPYFKWIPWGKTAEPLRIRPHRGLYERKKQTKVRGK